MKDDPTFDELNSSHSQAVWIRVMKREQNRREREEVVQERREVDVYEILEPILLRPAMYFGRPSITAFFHFYYGITYLGCGHGGPFMYKLKNDLRRPEGFTDWVCEKRGFAKNIDTAYSYLCAARNKLDGENYCVASVSPHKIEEIGFDLFVADLKEFRAQ